MDGRDYSFLPKLNILTKEQKHNVQQQNKRMINDIILKQTNNNKRWIRGVVMTEKKWWIDINEL